MNDTKASGLCHWLTLAFSGVQLVGQVQHPVMGDAAAQEVLRFAGNEAETLVHTLVAGRRQALPEGKADLIRRLLTILFAVKVCGVCLRFCCLTLVFHHRCALSAD